MGSPSEPSESLGVGIQRLVIGATVAARGTIICVQDWWVAQGGMDPDGAVSEEGGRPEGPSTMKNHVWTSASYVQGEDQCQ